MEIIDCEQGSGEWLRARLGLPTASCFGQIVKQDMTPRTGDMPNSYMAQLIAERLMGEAAMVDFTSFATERGEILEAEAWPWYELETGCDVERVGLVKTKLNTGDFGYSPDGLVYEGGRAVGAIEVKCPEALSKSASYVKMLWGDDEAAAKPYLAQCLGGILIAGLDWLDLVCYHPHPKLKNRIVRLSADAYGDELDALALSLSKFNQALTAREEALRCFG